MFMYSYGDIIEVQNEINDTVEEGIVIFAEPGPVAGSVDVYLKSETASKNDKIENKCEPYWRIITISND